MVVQVISHSSAMQRLHAPVNELLLFAMLETEPVFGTMSLYNFSRTPISNRTAIMAATVWMGERKTSTTFGVDNRNLQ